MSPALQTWLYRASIGAVVLAICGSGLHLALRNPVEDLRRQQPAANLLPAAPQVPRATRPPRPRNDYAGSAVCAECHADLSKQYQDHPMGRSWAHVLEVEPVEDYVERTTFHAAPSTRTDLRLRYYVERRSDGVYHHEQAFESDGSVVYDQAVPVHYAVGSGQRGRSYITNRDGILLMSPVTWYTQKSRWDFSPGYQLKNLRFERRITEGCVTCHAGRVALEVGDLADVSSDAGQPNRFAAEPIVEAAIGCERCHGPAQAHVEFHRGTALEGVADTIVNPADLDPDRRDSVCFQCHLQGVDRFPRYGRTEFDFRPGDLVSDVWTVFLQGTGVEHDQTTEAVSQVQQMLASRCYRESDGRLGCVSCHDPHSLPSAEQRISFYRTRCLSCHGENHSQCSLPVAERLAVTPEDSCIDCHMPPIAANDVPHTSQTDHRVLRMPAGDHDAATGRQPVLTVFGEQASGIDSAELDRARGLLLLVHAERKESGVLAAQAVPLLKQWLERAPDDQSVAEALGAAYWMNRDVTAAVDTWTLALSQNPANESILGRLVAVLHDSGRLEEGLQHGRRLVALNPWYHDHFGRLAHMYGRRRQFEQGIEAARRAVELNPAAGRIHAWLSEAYSIVGDEVKAAEHRAMFEKLRARDR